MAKKRDASKELEQERKNILQERQHWKTLRDYGCNDPFWPDGINMNLTRNHIIFARMRVQELCQELGCSLPEEYLLDVPPEVPDGYMAGGGKNRPHISQPPNGFSRRKPKWDDDKLSFL